MGVRGAVLEVSESLQKSWCDGFELIGAQIEPKGIVSVRRGNSVVSVYPLMAHDGTPLLAVQYKEFLRKQPDKRELANEIIEKLIALGAKRHDTRHVRD